MILASVFVPVQLNTLPPSTPLAENHIQQERSQERSSNRSQERSEGISQGRSHESQRRSPRKSQKSVLKTTAVERGTEIHHWLAVLKSQKKGHRNDTSPTRLLHGVVNHMFHLKRTMQNIHHKLQCQTEWTDIGHHYQTE